MSITDPLADLLTRVRNGQAANKSEVVMPCSKLKIALCKVLKDQGYIEDYNAAVEKKLPKLSVRLKYYKGIPVIENIQRVSKPGRRVYRSADSITPVLGGFGIAIVSTSKGLMTDSEARKSGNGGEVLCTVS
jgi:small subunit ribosomal protein S8